MTSPNPSGKALPEKLAARSLALACQDAATDEEIAEWLLTIAIDGKWPEGRPRRGGHKPVTTPERTALVEAGPPDGGQRMAALKEFLLRRDGQPMQAVVLKADIEARARVVNNANDAIALDDIDPTAAGALELVLMKALGLGIGAANIAGAIDVDSSESKDP